MASTFNLLRANDLIWSFVINNYLLGKDVLPFDLLYWNADATNMPAAMHSYYLRKMYLENRLCQPNGLHLLGTRIDLSQVTVPSFIISTRDDHIAPWQSTYAATQIYKGPVEFVLGGSGHIAGIINAPAANKYSYWTNKANPATPEAWLEGATEHKGSWWNHWTSWQAQHAGPRITPRNVKGGLEAAPGSYVKVRA
jgi:polyhydroxyalkanoate synthase subunit PhaC